MSEGRRVANAILFGTTIAWTVIALGKEIIYHRAGDGYEPVPEIA